MTITTKLELAQRLAEVNALYAQARERISALEVDLEIARKAARVPAAAARPDPAYFEQYGAYVDACRAHARATHQRVVSYVSANAWRAARSVPA